MPFCPKCGQEVPSGAKFCVNCGAVLGQVGPGVPPPPPAPVGATQAMSVEQNISSSFNYAKGLLSDAGRYIILLILGIIPIVNLIVTGYGARIIQTTPEVGQPPKLERYGDMFIEGLKIAVAGFIYMIIPIILIAAGAGSVFAPLWSSGYGPSLPAWGFALAGFGVLLLLVGIVLAFVILIFSSMGIAHMLKTNNFGKAFAFGEINRIIGRIGWGRYIIWLLVLFLIGLVIGGIASIPYVGGILVFIAGPFLIGFFYRSVGITYSGGASSISGAQIQG